MKGAELRWWAQTVGAAVLTAWALTSFVVRPFRIPTASMEDTLRAGDRVLVLPAAYGLRVPGTRARWPARAPKRGDLLVFEFPTEDPAEVHCHGPQAGKLWLKRAVGVPGDVVAVKDGVFFLNGAQAGSEPFAKRTAPAPCAKSPVELPPAAYQKAWEERRLDMELGEGVRDHFGPVTVPAGAVFALGDNRDGSCDSRFWGPVWDRYVAGKAVFIYWPPSRMGFAR